MIRLIQIQNRSTRAVALVDEPQVQLLEGTTSILRLAEAAIESRTSLASLISKKATGPRYDYDPIYRGESPWRLLPPIDHPHEPARCLVSGTGLTHLGSAKNRQAMHDVEQAGMTDSMKIFQWGLEGGKPTAGKIGIAPEWFYKGNGSILRAHGEPLERPPYAEDGGEEAEIREFILLTQMESRAASAWPSAMNSPITNSKRRIT